MKAHAPAACLWIALIAGCSDSDDSASPSGYAPPSETSAYADQSEPSAEPEVYDEEAKESVATAWEDGPHLEWEAHGYPCTQDCSGHEAGYEWAEENDITYPDDCGGSSQSFIEDAEPIQRNIGSSCR